MKLVMHSITKGMYIQEVKWLLDQARIDYAFNYKELGEDNISSELKKLLSIFARTTGCSSGIQCPEFGTIISVTFCATIFNPYATLVINIR